MFNQLNENRKKPTPLELHKSRLAAGVQLDTITAQCLDWNGMKFGSSSPNEITRATFNVVSSVNLCLHLVDTFGVAALHGSLRTINQAWELSTPGRTSGMIIAGVSEIYRRNSSVDAKRLATKLSSRMPNAWVALAEAAGGGSRASSSSSSVGGGTFRGVIMARIIADAYNARLRTGHIDPRTTTT